MLVNNKITNARHVDIIEKDTYCIGLEDSDIDNNKEDESEDSDIGNKSSDAESNQNISGDSKNNDDVYEDASDQIVNSKSNEIRSARKFQENSRCYNKDFVTQYVYVYCNNIEAPCNFEEAIKSKNSSQWKRAMDNEIESLNYNKTWSLVAKPNNQKIIDVMWIYRKKNANTFKARLVARGFQQEEHSNNVYSPIARMQILKLLLAYCCQYRLKIHQMDVETAFLNGKISTEVYIKQPEGYSDGSNKVLVD